GFGTMISVIGSINGKNTKINTRRIGAVFNVTADESTLLGSLKGGSDVNITDSALKFESTGKKALLFGGYDTNTDIMLHNSDTQAVVHSAIGKDTLAAGDRVRIVNGRRRIIINDAETERPIIYDYT
ncbi:MAG: hypothetical protein IJJ57_00345, partial [Ruminococcus sp.]|nr:hypothetical protein [Ruminococcus sp.]